MRYDSDPEILDLWYLDKAKKGQEKGQGKGKGGQTKIFCSRIR